MVRYRVTRYFSDNKKGSKPVTLFTTHGTKARANKVAEDLRSAARKTKLRLRKKGITFKYRITVRKVS